jgi:hypothetical protein
LIYSFKRQLLIDCFLGTSCLIIEKLLYTILPFCEVKESMIYMSCHDYICFALKVDKAFSSTDSRESKQVVQLSAD